MMGLNLYAPRVLEGAAFSLQFSVRTVRAKTYFLLRFGGRILGTSMRLVQESRPLLVLQASSAGV